ncbi:MAG: DUF302 domain-containing protein [Bacteroidales bacterium]|nr:DUF302 domain-containing protein [Bacteroidales bacterium]
MKYYISKILKDISFDEAVNYVTELLKEQGFGIITQIDVKHTMKEKLDVDFRKYKILGACNPGFAYKALQLEDKIGTMLPCNVIVQVNDAGEVEVAAIDPAASMMAVENARLAEIASEIRQRLEKVIANL